MNIHTSRGSYRPDVCIINRYPDALSDFNNALASFNGNLIDYKQLGMKLKLYACEVYKEQDTCTCCTV